MNGLLLSLLALQAVSPDTITIRAIPNAPPRSEIFDPARYGPPQVRIRTGQGTAMVWLVKAADTMFLAAIIPDSTPYWGDDFVVSLDPRGAGAPTPQDENFQLYFRRMLDSSVVFRGRNGRWEPPRDDPDWRLGSARAGGGWEISSSSDARGWNLLLRLDPAWLTGDRAHRPRVAFRIYDNSPGGWFSWPSPDHLASPTMVERIPALWIPIR